MAAQSERVSRLSRSQLNRSDKCNAICLYYSGVHDARQSDHRQYYHPAPSHPTTSSADTHSAQFGQDLSTTAEPLRRSWSFWHQHRDLHRPLLRRTIRKNEIERWAGRRFSKVLTLNH